MLAAIMLEDLAVLAVEFLERLEAIRREAGRDHGEALHAGFRERIREIK